MSVKTARVELNARGIWEIVLSDQRQTILCSTLGEASSEARRCAADRRPCELIVRDAYHRVLDCELITARGEWRRRLPPTTSMRAR